MADENNAASSPAETETEYVAPDLEKFTPEEHSEWLKTGAVPKPKKTEEAAASKPAGADSGTAKTSEEPTKPIQNADTRAKELEDEIADLKRQKAERVQKLLTERRQLREELSKPAEETRPESQPGAKAETRARPTRPKIEDFEEIAKYDEAFDKYTEDLADWKAEQRIEAERRSYAERQQREQIEAANRETAKNFNDGLKRARERYPDYDKVTKEAGEIPLNPVMDGFILRSPNCHDLIYHLAGHPDEALEIAGLEPFECVRRLVTIESGISAKQKAPPTKTISETKPPPRELSATNRAAEDEAVAAQESGNVGRYMEVMNAREIARLTGK